MTHPSITEWNIIGGKETLAKQLVGLLKPRLKPYMLEERRRINSHKIRTIMARKTMIGIRKKEIDPKTKRTKQKISGQ